MAAGAAANAQDAGLEALARLAEPEAPVEPQPPVDTSQFAGSVSVNEFDLVDLHVSSEDIRAVLQLLSMQSERNILVSPTVQATISADLYGVTFYEALDAILSINGFRYVEKGNFIYVFTNDEITDMEQQARRPVNRVLRLNYLNAADAMRFLEPLLSDAGSITIQSDATAGFSIGDSGPVGADSYVHDATLVLHDLPENIAEIERVAAELDTRPMQILVETTILQAKITEENAFGVDFAIIGDMDFLDFAGAGGPLGVVDGLIGGVGEDVTGTTVNAAGADGNGYGVGSSVGNTAEAGGFKAGVVSGDVAVFLRLLDQVTDTTVVSNPKILTLNRQPAQVLVGVRFGYLSTQVTETGSTQTVEFLETGTSLQVRPFVMQDGMIRMELRPKVSTAEPRSVTTTGGAALTVPDENTSELVTNVMVRDGQTVVLGGLFTETTTATRRQVPFLGDIPVVGAAFRGHEDETRRNEIIFLVTPSIVNDQILTLQGEAANEYVEAARVGARAGLLPWSRDRRVSRLLIEARRAAEEGDLEQANFKIQRALALAPNAQDAIRLREELTGADYGFPSRSFLEDIIGGEIRDIELPEIPAEEVSDAGAPEGSTVIDPALAASAASGESAGASSGSSPELYVRPPQGGLRAPEATADAGFSLSDAADPFSSEPFSGEPVITQPMTAADYLPSPEPGAEELMRIAGPLGEQWTPAWTFPFISPENFAGWETAGNPGETALGEASQEAWPPQHPPFREGLAPDGQFAKFWRLPGDAVPPMLPDAAPAVTSVPTDD